MALAEPLGVRFDLAYIQQHFLGRSFPTVAATIREEFAVTLPPDFEATYRRLLLKEFETRLRPTSGVKQAIAELTVPFCVATSSSPERAGRSLEITGLLPLFDGSIFTASQVKHGKPAPDLFLHVAASFQTPVHKCLVIEDSLPGLEAASRAGMAVWHYVGGSHIGTVGATGKGPSLAETVPRSFDSWGNFSNMLANAHN